MASSIKVLREVLISKLSSVKEDNVSIADIAINRKRLLETLKLQTQPDADILTINYGKVFWYDRYQKQNGHPLNSYWVTEEVKDQPCIQISCNHTTMRFLNKPKAKYGIEPKVIPLNFVDHADYTKPELTGIPLDTQELIRALNFALPCVATETGRPVLNCVLFDSSDNTLKLVSADGFRLMVVPIPAKGIPQDKVLIHRNDIIKLLSYLKAIKPIGKGKIKTYPEVYLTYDYKTVKFSSDNGSIEFEKQAYTFPDYPQLIPKDGTKIECIASDMLDGVKALSHIAKDGSGIIRLQFQHSIPLGKLLLTAKSEDLGESSVDCDAIVESDCKIATTAKYLTDLLSPCGQSRITLKLTTPSSPLVFSVDGKTCVIMPMFVQWESDKPQPEAPTQSDTEEEEEKSPEVTPEEINEIVSVEA